MKTFEQCFNVLMNTEKGYWDDPVGGPTMWGITERVARKNGYKGDMHKLPISLAHSIAKTEYWDKYKCDDMPMVIAFQIFDTAYNGGRPVFWLQSAVGVTADGVIGPKTIAAVYATDPLRIVLLFNAARIKYLTGLTNWSPNSRGWARRIADNLEHAASETYQEKDA